MLANYDLESGFHKFMSGDTLKVHLSVGLYSCFSGIQEIPS